MAQTFHRTTFETSRLLEYFSPKELSMQLGAEPPRWGLDTAKWRRALMTVMDGLIGRKTCWGVTTPYFSRQSRLCYRIRNCLKSGQRPLLSLPCRGVVTQFEFFATLLAYAIIACLWISNGCGKG
jgi:hypothetical protein